MNGGGGGCGGGFPFYLWAAYANAPSEKCRVVKDSSGLILGHFSLSSRVAIVIKPVGINVGGRETHLSRTLHYILENAKKESQSQECFRSRSTGG